MLMLVAAALAGPPSPEQIAALTGTWRLAEAREAVQARVDGAVDAGLAPHNAVVRSIARPMIAKVATFCDEYRTTLTTAGFTLACDTKPSVTVPFDQPPREITGPEGKPVTVSARMDGDVVELTFTGDAGGQRVRYRSGPGGAFVVHKTLHADRLGADFVWETTYTRR